MNASKLLSFFDVKCFCYQPQGGDACSSYVLSCLQVNHFIFFALNQLSYFFARLYYHHQVHFIIFDFRKSYAYRLCYLDYSYACFHNLSHFGFHWQRHLATCYFFKAECYLNDFTIAVCNSYSCFRQLLHLPISGTIMDL